MKKEEGFASRFKGIFKKPSSESLTVSKKALLAATISLLTLASCKKDAREGKSQDSDEVQTNAWLTKLKTDLSLQAQTITELKGARTASIRYRSLDSAIADGYTDIDVVRANMGYHFLNSGLLDTVFNSQKPEILVYNKTYEGEFQLVAVEYAVPISLRPLTPPTGFTGSSDTWKYDTEFGLWLLHAWVWEYNPAGVFKPTNPDVHVHI